MVESNAICSFFSGRNHYLYFSVSSPDAPTLYFLFCRRRGAKHKENVERRIWVCDRIYNGIYGIGSIGGFLREYQTVVNVVSGLIVIFFGLNFLGVFKLNLFKGIQRDVDTDNMGFLSAFVFGVVFSIGWTPCVGTFLGSALMLASQQSHAAAGVLMLLAYSLGLGIPFVLSAVLIDYLKTAFDWIKRHYRLINGISGGLLILIGVMMATGTFGRLMSLFS